MEKSSPASHDPRSDEDGRHEHSKSAIARKTWCGALLRRLLVAGPVAAIFAIRTVSAGGPAGIYALLPSENSERTVELANRPIWNNPSVVGVTVRTVWKNVAPAQGARDWSYFDDALREARASGKLVGLSLAAGIYTPEWIYGTGVHKFDFTVTGPWLKPTASSMPVPWDPAFQREWGRVIGEMGQKYDADPNVAYVMISGVGFDIESFFVKTPQDVANFNALGGDTRWLSGAEQILDLYAAAFPDKAFVLAMAPPIPGAQGVALMNKLVEYGVHKYPDRCGLMYDGLDAEAATEVYQDAAVRKFSNVSPTGFQMVWSTDGLEGRQRLRGTLGAALERAVSLRAHWVEVYEVDCNDPTYEKLLGDVNDRLKTTDFVP